MKKLKKFGAVVAVSLSVTLSMPSYFMLPSLTVEAHSGRTDSRGGHKDNKNKSGLGSYHYHCGGYPAHLHENGVCPYSGSKTSSSSTSTTTSTTTATTTTATTSKYNYSYTAKYKSASTDFSNRSAKGQFSQEIVAQMPNYSDMTASLLSQSELEDYTYLKNKQDIDDMSKLIFIKMYDYVLSQQVTVASNTNGIYDNAIFSAQYYASKYPELVTVLGNDELALYNHFLNSGMAEGRQGCATFNVHMYMIYNPDLQQAFGSDIVAYYHHYLNNGQHEGRMAY